MNKITAYIVLVLFVVVFHFGQNAHSASSAITEPPADMSGINEMHKVLLKKNKGSTSLKFSENLLDQNYEETWLYSTICKTGELE